MSAPKQRVYIHRLFDDLGVMKARLPVVSGQMLNVLSVPSLYKLNGYMHQVGQPNVQVDLLSPHVLVEGCEPHEEDTWRTIEAENVMLWREGYFFLPRVIHRANAYPQHKAMDMLLLEYRTLVDNTPCFGSRYRVECLKPGQQYLTYQYVIERLPDEQAAIA